MTPGASSDAAAAHLSETGCAASHPPKPVASAPPAPRGPIRKGYDLVVVGGGIAGTSTAISAARHGVRVALVHNRAMLGGNSSSEVKLYPEDNDLIQPWIKEGGIHEEIHTEERVRNHRPWREGTMNCHWDLVLYEWVTREENIDLYLNTHAHRAIMKGRSRIASVFCFQLGTEKTYELSGDLFVDCTGDGYLAHCAGADYRWGREGRDEYREPAAPTKASEQVMGNTLMFTAYNTGRPVPFKRPQWAAEFPSDRDLMDYEIHNYIEGGYWWIEVGSPPYHPIADNDKIVHEALRQVLGVWDHIKNHCARKEKAANYGLDVVGFWPYKREARRILGDHVLTQHHVQDPQPLPDAVAYGAWGIDIHVPGGILNHKDPFEWPSGPELFERLGTLPYGIPLRSLYSRNVENLMMAGRPISCSYLAFASSRVLSTGSIVGQAVGVAASLCKKHRATPRMVAQHHVDECRQIILRDDGHIPGLINEDPADLALSASVTAASECGLRFPDRNLTAVELNLPLAQLFPVSDNRIDKVDLLLASKLDRQVELTLGLRAAEHVWDFRATRDIARATATVPPGQPPAWVSFAWNTRVEPGRLYYIYTISPTPGVSWMRFVEKPGEAAALPIGTTAAELSGMSRWRPLAGGVGQIIRVYPQPRPCGPGNVVTGANRPDRWTNIWVSDPDKPLPAWLELHWPEAVELNTVQLTFDTDQNRRQHLPLFRYPECVKDYDLEVWTGSNWRKLHEGRDNYARRRVHRFPTTRTDRLRLTVLATNGVPSARVYEVRAYKE